MCEILECKSTTNLLRCKVHIAILHQKYQIDIAKHQKPYFLFLLPVILQS